MFKQIKISHLKCLLALEIQCSFNSFSNNIQSMTISSHVCHVSQCLLLEFASEFLFQSNKNLKQKSCTYLKSLIFR